MAKNKEVLLEILVYVDTHYKDLDAQKLKELFKYNDKIAIFFNIG
jgi:hypothetical protein